MENERALKVYYFKSLLYRIFTWKFFYIQIVMIILLAAFSPLLLRELCDSVNLLSEEMIETFKFGSVYNVGVLTVSSLNYSKISIEDMGIGALAGTCSQFLFILLALSIVLHENKCGYIQKAIMKGYNRSRIFFAYIGVIILIFLPLMLIYICLVTVSSGYIKGQEIIDPFSVYSSLSIKIIFSQYIMMLSIIIMAVVFGVLLADLKAIIIVEAIIVFVPSLPTYVDMLGGRNYHFEKYSVIWRLLQSGHNGEFSIVGNMSVSLISCMIVVFIGVIVYNRMKMD